MAWVCISALQSTLIAAVAVSACGAYRNPATSISCVGTAGKVGYSTSQALRAANVPVRAVLRNEVKACRLKAIGCDIAFADLQDSVSLGRAIADAEAVQVILPPSLQAEDVVGKMRQSSAAQALAQARPKRVLVISNEVLLGVPAKRDRQSNPELYSKQSPDEIQRECVAWKPIGSHGALVMLMSITLHSVESLYPQARQWLCHPPK